MGPVIGGIWGYYVDLQSQLSIQVGGDLRPKTHGSVQITFPVNPGADISLDLHRPRADDTHDEEDRKVFLPRSKAQEVTP